VLKRAIVLIALVALAVPALASSYDRQPVVLSGLTADDWGGTNTRAQGSLLERFPGIKSVRCTGVIMRGQASRSSFLHGQTRYWDKNYCEGGLQGGAPFTVIRDAKGETYWKIYRLRGASVANLQRAARPQPVAPRSRPPTPRCDSNYRGACVPIVPYDLDCADIDGPVFVVGRDPHGFDGDGDGVGCES